MPISEPDHYAALGLDRRCTEAQIRAAYRLLAKRHHPDINPDSAEAIIRTQALNAAYEILSNPERRQNYDSSRDVSPKKPRTPAGPQGGRNVSQDVFLKIEKFFRGATLEVRVNDPASETGPELYELRVPSGTAPGTRFRVPRTGTFVGGSVLVRVRPRPDFRFKTRGSDLRCDLRIAAQRAAQGGSEMVAGPMGGRLRIDIPRGVMRGATLRVVGEGLPKTRGGRGDLLVRVTYRPEVRITRKPSY